MKYHWGEWSLDRDAGLLKRRGQAVDVSRKVLECIGHLIAHRDRVIGFDELIRKVWGHDNVTNHQLSQVILSSRRALGDDGQTQRLIRTAPGLGYQWVGTLDNGPPTSEDAPAQSLALPQDQAQPSPALIADPEASSAPGATSEHVPTAPQRRQDAEPADDDLSVQPVAARTTAVSRTTGITLALTVSLLLSAVAYYWLRTEHAASPSARSDTPAGAVSIQSLHTAMRAGDFETVREGLAALPPSVAESPDAMLIAMRLDYYRGRFDRAQDKLDAQMALAKGVEDPIWQAKLLVFKSMLQGRQKVKASEREMTAQAALDLLEPLGEDAAPEVLADALRVNSTAVLQQGRHEEALRDLNRAGDLYEKIGDTRSAITVRTDRARIWMRTGRLEDALRVMQGVSEDYEALSDKIGEVGAYNTMTRIQMELLRWDEALQTSDRTIAVLRETPEIERRDRALQLRAQALTRLGRLRQARALLEETGALQGDDASSVIATLFLLEAGNTSAALKASEQAFLEGDRDDPDDILLDTREGALLMWITARQRLIDSGATMPSPSPAQIDALRNPRSIAGTIAAARWMMGQNDDARAESLLEEALSEAARKGMRYHMVLASESTLALLLRQGRTAEAERLLEDVRAFDRERTDKDYDFTRQRWTLAVATGDESAAQSLGVRLAALAGERRVPKASEVDRVQVR